MIHAQINQSKSQIFQRDFLTILGVSILFALSSWIAIPLPFIPVPISFTVHLILFFSVFLGKRGALATSLYFAQGIVGLPVFSNGHGGIAYLLGPTGGYLIGYVIASSVIGLLSEQLKEKTPSKIFGLMLLGNLLIFACGLPQLSLFVGVSNALNLGFYPFLGGDFIKLILASLTLAWAM